MELVKRVLDVNRLGTGAPHSIMRTMVSHAIESSILNSNMKPNKNRDVAFYQIQPTLRMKPKNIARKERIVGNTLTMLLKTEILRCITDRQVS